MKHHTSIIYGLDEINKPIKELKSLMHKYYIFTFEGTLGAGKTTLIKKLLAECGVKEVITSPTYNYVNIYTNDIGQKFCHFDLYRLQNAQEFFELGFNEYLFQENTWSFIEWPEVIRPLLQHNVCNIKIDYVDAEKRTLTIGQV